MSIFSNHKLSLCVSVACLVLISSSIKPTESTASISVPAEAFDCAIYPSAEADIGTSSPGVIARVDVDRSDYVQRDQVLAVMDSTAEEATVALAKARAESASEINFRRASAAHSKRQLSRIEKLNQDSSVSSQDHDDRKTEAVLGGIQLQQALDSQRILALELARAQVVLAQRTVRAPFSGVVVERYKTEGEHVDDQPVIKIARIDPLHIETILATEHLGKIHAGMVAMVQSEAVPDVQWQATVDRVDAVVDVASGTFGVRLSLPNPEHQIVAGVRCQLVFEAKPVRSPAAALPQSDRKPVKPVAYAHYEQLKIRLGDRARQRAVALSDLATADVPQLGAALASAAASDNAETAVPAAEATNMGTVWCLSSDKFDSRTSAERVASLWLKKSVVVEIREQQTIETRGALIRSPLLQTRQAAQLYVAALEEVGVSDYLLPSGQGPIRVSIGAYSETAVAKTMLERLEAAGIDAQYSPWQKKSTTYTLVADSPDVPDCD